jgi:hypothetical protein
METIGPRAVHARFDPGSGRVNVELANGCALVIAPGQEPSLREATPAELEQVGVSPCGRFLEWSARGVQICIAGFVAAELGMRAWLDRDRAARAGSVRSEAKARAARENGRKGGRPRLNRNTTPA